MKNTIRIQLFEEDNQDEIDMLLNEIASEFELQISNNNKSPSQVLDKYWITFDNNKVIGTIGIVCFKKKFGVLKSMFVKKEYRGKSLGISNILLNEFFDYCKEENIDHIYLGTMTQFKAAHKFYEKNGFKRINKNKLPSGFINNQIDDIFYYKILE